jgi:hypothetical protein
VDSNNAPVGVGNGSILDDVAVIARSSLRKELVLSLAPDANLTV